VEEEDEGVVETVLVEVMENMRGEILRELMELIG